MSKKVKLAFLWHMHQPYYKDDKEKSTLMPWVFLHCIKDYYDIPWYSEEFSSIKATYNLVPSLIYQIESYINRSAHDKLLEIMVKPIYSLSSEDIKFLESYIFLSNEKNMIKPFERYYNLYLKYKAHNSISDFNENELIDCEVLFLLSWCGNYLRQNNSVVQRLLHVKQFYTHNDKIELIDTLIEFLPEVLNYYKKLSDSGKISLSTTPFYHPITPLLLNINSAIDARSDVHLPHVESSFEHLGKKNTEEAINYYNKIFNKKPTGFWPAEGSVNQKTAELFIENGIEWFCSDEEILFKTLGGNHKQNIYKNYSLNINGRAIDVRFRDHYLSDAIGFEYSNKEPQESAIEFVEHLRDIYNMCDFSPLINVILDGENAWEFFPNNAKEFFYELYSLIEAQDWIESVTADEISSDKDIVVEEINHIATGSWINGNFDIWIGNSQKNRAWELLDITKKDYEKHSDKLSEQVKKEIEKEFMIALGSDWFWWYGDDHYTLLAQEFDELFRKHLINIYQYMGVVVPAPIFTPIVTKSHKNKFHVKPIDCIHPTIDGKRSNYFEWLNSGTIDIKKEFSVMDSKNNIIKTVHYGYNAKNLFFLFDGKFKNLKLDSKLELILDNKKFLIDILEGQQYLKIMDANIELTCTQSNIELQISRDIFDSKRIKFQFSVIDENDRVQVFPTYSDFFITIENLKLHNWYI
ncbi:MAG: glycoside hydrolase family 57 protein [Campylobacterota bacterium]|nr:glycoside hydrolase family 57 protein [Campylobacterota bacterium]